MINMNIIQDEKTILTCVVRLVWLFSLPYQVGELLCSHVRTNVTSAGTILPPI